MATLRFLGTFRSLAILLALLAVATLAVVAQRPAPASAHPLSNFTINSYSRFDLYADAVRLRYVLDMAELPAFLEINERVDANENGELEPAEIEAHRQRLEREIIPNLDVRVDGAPAGLAVLGSALSFPEGDGGLDLLRFVAILEAPVEPGSRSVAFEDHNYADRIGWRDAGVFPAIGVELTTSTAPAVDATRELTAYSKDQLGTPPNVRDAAFTYTAGDGAPAPPPAAATTAYSGESGPATTTVTAGRGADPFAALVAADDLTLTVLLGSILVALVFGAIHALEPGHGKTIVAGYFVVAGGNLRNALLLGLSIAVTHSIGVLAIGALTLYGSQFILPEHLYPWLKLIAGALVVVLGVWLLLTRFGGGQAIRRALNYHPHIPGLTHSHHAHEHEHAHAHAHAHDHQHPQAEAAPSGRPPSNPPWRALITLGLVDGMVPTPSTIVVLVAAVALNRILFGMLLIVAFSVGLAVVLTAVSLSAVYAPRLSAWLCSEAGPLRGRRRLRALAAATSGNGRLLRVLPVAGAVLFISMGLYLTIRAAADPVILG